jgi:hypothetical protein
MRLCFDLQVTKTNHPGQPTAFRAHLALPGCPFGLCGPISYRSERDAVAGLKAEVVERLTEHQEACKNSGRRVIGTGDGSVFIVEFRNGNWGYEICGAGRSYAGASCGMKSLGDAIAYAKAHATDSFGGVAWEHPL